MLFPYGVSLWECVCLHVATEFSVLVLYMKQNTLKTTRKLEFVFWLLLFYYLSIYWHHLMDLLSAVVVFSPSKDSQM